MPVRLRSIAAPACGKLARWPRHADDPAFSGGNIDFDRLARGGSFFIKPRQLELVATDAGSLTTRTRREPSASAGTASIWSSSRSRPALEPDRRPSSSRARHPTAIQNHRVRPAGCPAARSLTRTTWPGHPAGFLARIGHVLDRRHGIDQSLAQVGRRPRSVRDVRQPPWRSPDAASDRGSPIHGSPAAAGRSASKENTAS